MQLRVLVISHMYPSRFDETYGIFIHRSVKAVDQRRKVLQRIVSPVPWIPAAARHLKRGGKWARMPPWEDFEGIRVIRPRHVELPLKSFWPLRGLSMAIRLFPILRELQLHFPFQIIHSHTATPDGVAGIFLGRRFHVPTVCSLRGSDVNAYPFRSPLYMTLTRKVLQETDMLLATSQALLNAARSLGAKSSRIACLYNGVDTEQFRPSNNKLRLREELGLRADARIFIFVGNCIEHKGIMELSESFIRLAKRRPRAHLVVVGDGPLLPTLQRHFARENLSSCLTSTGRIPHHLVARYLQSADFFVLPSYMEGMPNAMLEAMACGLPPLVTSVGGIPEVVRDEHNGLIVPKKDADALYVKLMFLFENNEISAQLSKAARHSIEKRFSWSAHAESLEALYTQLIPVNKS